MAMVPHERTLVKRLEGKPFALLGVNFDNSKEALKKFDGRQGPIGKKWNIRFLPTIYVLDHNGMIRYKGVRDKEMDAAVDTLLKEVEKK